MLIKPSHFFETNNDMIFRCVWPGTFGHEGSVRRLKFCIVEDSFRTSLDIDLETFVDEFADHSRG